MSTKVERLEHNMARLTVEVPAEEFEKAMQVSYNRNKNRISIQGFRKGKAPRKIIERMYGPEVFYEDAANHAINMSYEDARKESGLEIMSRPEIDIVQIENGQPFIYTADVAVRPDVVIKKYMGLEVSKQDVTVTDEEIDRAVDRERDKNARMVDVDDRPAQMGDTLNLDFDGSVDGEPFDGGKGENYTLVLGSNTFIPGFEEQLVGKSIGEETEVKVTFPEDYHAEELKGKDAVFKCLIHRISVKETPEADDEFAMDVSEFDTMEEYRADLRKTLEEEKAAGARQAKENEAVDALIAEMEADIPEAMIENSIDNLENDYAMRISQQGLPFETYLQYMGMTRDIFREQLRPQAEMSIKSRLALEQVVADAGIEISDEKLDEELKKQADAYKMELDKVREMLGEEGDKQTRLDMAVQEAITLITDNAVEVEKKEEEAAEEASEENTEE